MANKGNPQAQYFAAKRYFEKDFDKAIELLNSSSENGEPFAMFLLGLFLTEGKLQKHDLFKAEELFAKVAEMGETKSHICLNGTREMIAYHVPYYLVKVTAKEFAEKLLDGEVFMRSISWFVPFERHLRDKSQSYVNRPSIDDSMEGLTMSLGGKPNPYGHWVNEAGEPINDGFRKSGLIDMLLLREKIHCLFSLEYDEVRGRFIKPDLEMVNFGDTAVIITDPEEFLKRVSNAVKKRFNVINYYLAYRRVAYDVDISASKTYSEFHKNEDYASQKEFRIALDLTEGHIDKYTFDTATDFAVMQYLDSCGKVGMNRPATLPLTPDEQTAYSERRFRDIIPLDENPNSLSDTLTLKIGDIRDICVTMPISEFVEIHSVDYFTDRGFKPPSQVVAYVPPRKANPIFFKNSTAVKRGTQYDTVEKQMWRGRLEGSLLCIAADSTTSLGSFLTPHPESVTATIIIRITFM